MPQSLLTSFLERLMSSDLFVPCFARLQPTPPPPKTISLCDPCPYQTPADGLHKSAWWYRPGQAA